MRFSLYFDFDFDFDFAIPRARILSDVTVFVNHEPEGRIELPTSTLPWLRSATELLWLVALPAGRQVYQLSYNGVPEPPVGFEPTTYALQKRCSTIELGWHRLCMGQDSNLRSRMAPDLQSGAIDRSATHASHQHSISRYSAKFNLPIGLNPYPNCLHEYD